MMLAIQGLGKHFGGIRAVDGVDLHLDCVLLSALSSITAGDP